MGLRVGWESKAALAGWRQRAYLGIEGVSCISGCLAAVISGWLVWAVSSASMFVYLQEEINEANACKHLSPVLASRRKYRL